MLRGLDSNLLGEWGLSYNKVIIQVRFQLTMPKLEVLDITGALINSGTTS